MYLRCSAFARVSSSVVLSGDPLRRERVVARQRAVVDGELAVERHEVPVAHLHQRIDLDELGVAGAIGLIEFHEDVGDRAGGRRIVAAHRRRQRLLRRAP